MFGRISVTKKVSPKINFVGATVTGASHIRRNLPNQDYIGYYAPNGANPPSILAVSDGHGSEKCFRSDVGSMIAVHTAIDILLQFAENSSLYPDPTLAKRTADEKLPSAIIKKWRERVIEHFWANGYSKAELEVASKLFKRPDAVSEEEITLMYGATLLAVLVTDSFILTLQLGDGDILEISKEGKVSYAVKSEKILGNATVSLCSERAWRYFKSGFQAISNNSPALIMVSTDGYSNSYAGEEGFLQAGKDYLDIIKSESLKYVDSQLEGWLKEVSTGGSGDDITVGLLKLRVK